MLLRLDKFISDALPVSRREAREMIRAGRVFLSGAPCSRPDRKLDPGKEPVTADGVPLTYRPFHYYMLDKPAGILTATRDASQETVLDLLPPALRAQGLFPVGRLDRDTTGLLLLTDDGDFAHRVISPKADVEKVYLAETAGEPDACDVRAFEAGVLLRDGTACLPAGLRPLGGGHCLVTVREGRYHQVKRMLASVGKPVVSLRRLSVGSLQIDEKLGPGGWRTLTDAEVKAVFARPE